MKRLFAVIAVLSFAAIISPVFGMYAIPMAIGASMLAPTESAVAFAGLNKEIWLDELMEGFYADDMFLTECRDLSAFVDNDVINLAEAGIDPNVLINNTTYPIAISSRTDLPKTITIDTFDTENTAVSRIEQAELAYDKLASIVFGHKNAMRMKIMEKGAHAIAPAADGTYTPVLVATGTIVNGTGNKSLRFSDIIRLQLAFDEAEMPAEGRILVLSTQHKSDLMNENLPMFNQITLSGELYGFKMYSLASKRMPRYNKTTGAKIAWGAAAAPSTDVYASFAFQKNEVARAMGTLDMFHAKAENDPINRRDVVGFQQRAIVIPIRYKGIAAIYSPAV